MRIIAGKYGGRKLTSFKADHVRPTTDRVKEAIFNKIQFEIAGQRVLDLFSGTGNLAFEALSREALSVTAVESSAKSVQIINKNKQLLQITSELEVIKEDVFRFLKKVHGQFDIIFIDPPFTKKIAHDVLEALSKSNCFDDETIIFIESSSQESVQESYSPLVRISHKSYGDKFLSLYKCKNSS